MKLQKVTHIVGLVSCALGAIFTASNPNRDMLDVMWPIIALCWCASSWMATISAEKN